MRTYLATIHRRTDHHKKRFALATSASFTLLIFSIWAVVNFSPNDRTPVVARDESEITPVESLGASASASWQGLKNQFNKAKSGLESIDVNNTYTSVRNDALNTNTTTEYGQ